MKNQIEETYLKEIQGDKAAIKESSMKVNKVFPFLSWMTSTWMCKCMPFTNIRKAV